jgi:hypothetical protein
MRHEDPYARHATKAFSSEVETGSREENALKSWRVAPATADGNSDTPHGYRGLSLKRCLAGTKRAVSI